MHVCFDIRKVGIRPYRKPVVTLGTFDGVHLGHRTIITNLMEKAEERKRKGVVVTYEPHPQSVVSPEDAPKVLTLLEEKLELLERLGVEETVVINFDRQLRECSAEEFLEEILLGSLDPGYLVVGDDHAFGKGRCGRIDLLKEAAQTHGFDLEVVPALISDGDRISSTRIRKELKEGEFANAKGWLGHAYPLSGKVVEGQKRGRELDYPTLNLQVHPEKLLPQDGVYAVTGRLNGRTRYGMIYIGPRHTFQDDVRTVEVHLFDLNKDPGLSEVEVWMERWVRAPRKFVGPEQLKRQLRFDEKRVREMFGMDCPDSIKK
jgi:riboflavin kinase/FMN adenylyltransferase